MSSQFITCPQCFAFLFLLSICACHSGFNNQQSTASTVTPTATPAKADFALGETVYLNAKGINSNIVPLSPTKEVLGGLLKSIVAKDSYALEQYYKNGEVLLIESNTPVLIIDSVAGHAYQVRVLEGKYKNVPGWVYAEWVEREQKAN